MDFSWRRCEWPLSMPEAAGPAGRAFSCRTFMTLVPGDLLATDVRDVEDANRLP